MKWRKGSSKSNKLNQKSDPYIELSDAYASHPQVSAPLIPHIRSETPIKKKTMTQSTRLPHQSNYQIKVERRSATKVKTQLAKALAEQDDEVCFDTAITWAEDESTTMAKTNTSEPRRVNIDLVNKPRQSKPGRIQRGRNAGCALSTIFKRAIKTIAQVKCVSFASKMTSIIS